MALPIGFYGGSNQSAYSQASQQVLPYGEMQLQFRQQEYPPFFGQKSAPITVGTNRILDATTATFPPGWSVTRAAGGATYLDSSGVLQTASANTARIDYLYNGTTWVVGGLLVEPASANSVPSFTGSLANASLGTNVTGIDGTVDAIPVIPNTGNAAHAFTLGSPPTTTQAVFSAIAKPNTYAQAGLRENASSGSSAAFALSGSGSVINTDKQGSIVPSNATIQALGNSRYRISFVLTNASAVSMSLALYPLSGYSSGDVQGFNWVGNGTDSVIFDQPVIEAGTGILTSVIPVGGSRAADVITFTLGAAATQLTFTFDDGSTQTITGLTSGSTYTIPTYLNRSRILYIDDDTVVTQNIGAASGVATVSGIGIAIAEGVGSSAGVATVAGVGTALATSTGAAAGAATVAGIGTAKATSTGSSAGVATVSGIGTALATSTGASAGAATVAGVGTAIALATGSSAGVGTATGVGTALATSVGASSGVGTATGVGSGTITSVGASAGTGTATGVGIAAATATGASAGAATVSGIGAAIALAVGSSAGVGTATGVGTAKATSVGASSGAATVSGVGTAIALAVGTASGIGTATAFGGTIGQAAGVATVSGIGTAIAIAVGTSAGVATVSGVGRATVTSAGASAGVGTATGVGIAAATTTGASSGIGAATGVGRAAATGVGTAAGIAIANAIGLSGGAPSPIFVTDVLRSTQRVIVPRKRDDMYAGTPRNRGAA